MNDATLEQIQSKIAFLERANSELSDQLYRQHREIEALTRRLRELADRLNATMAEERVRSPDDERPPHY
ncbi:MAG: SlyX family protein [Steroidobacterales bacterium]